MRSGPIIRVIARRDEGRPIRRLTAFFRGIRVDRSMAARVGLLAVAFIVPLSGAAAILIGQQSARIALTDRERSGIVLTTQAIAVVGDLRALRDRVLFDRDPGVAERERASEDLSTLYRSNAGTPGASAVLTNRLKALEADWDAVPEGPRGVREIVKTLATATSLFDIIDERSALDADPDAVTSLLLDAYGSQLPTISGRLDGAKVLLGVAPDHRTPSASDRIAAAILTGQARHAFDIAKSDVSIAASEGFAIPALTARVDALGRRFDAFVDLSSRTAPGESSQGLDRAADRVVDAVSAADVKLAATIDALLSGREQEEIRSLLLMRTEAGLVVLVGLWIALLLARTIRDRDRRELERAQNEAERLSAELERQRMLEDLSVTEAHFRAVFDRSSIGVAILDRDGNVLRSNRALLDMVDPIDGRMIGAGHPEFARLLAGDIETFTTEIQPLYPALRESLL